jgi:hypothetical protein
MVFKIEVKVWLTPTILDNKIDYVVAKNTKNNKKFSN